MIRLILFGSLITVTVMGCAHKDNYSPKTHLTAHEHDRMMTTIIRYLSKPPKRSDDSLKFNQQYDEYYNQQISSHQLMAYHIARDDEHFFLVKRRAPSIHDRYVATGGRMRFDKDWQLTEYEEVFRTWKLGVDTLESRALFLFDLMVKGEQLDSYYAKTAGFHYIEFPDDNVYFDKTSRSWKSKIIKSVEEYAKAAVKMNDTEQDKDTIGEP